MLCSWQHPTIPYLMPVSYFEHHNAIKFIVKVIHQNRLFTTT